MCWKNAFWFCWCAFFWTSSRVALDAQQKTCPVHHKARLCQEIQEWNREQCFRSPFSVLHTSLSLQKGKTASRVVCCKGRQSSTHWAITAQCTLKEALLHQVTSAHIMGRGGELGICSLGATTAHSSTLWFFLPSPSLLSHTIVAHKSLFGLHWGKILLPLI